MAKRFVVDRHALTLAVTEQQLSSPDERAPTNSGNRRLMEGWVEADAPLEPGERIVCDLRLGGLLRHYEHRAA